MAKDLLIHYKIKCVQLWFVCISYVWLFAYASYLFLTCRQHTHSMCASPRIIKKLTTTLTKKNLVCTAQLTKHGSNVYFVERKKKRIIIYFVYFPSFFSVIDNGTRWFLWLAQCENWNIFFFLFLRFFPPSLLLFYSYFSFCVFWFLWFGAVVAAASS